MLTSVLLSILVVLILYRLTRRWTSRLGHIPAVPALPVVGSVPFVRPAYIHISFDEWARKLGPVMVVAGPGEERVVASGYEGIRQMLITEGRAAGGRPNLFCSRYLLQGTGILLNLNPDLEWKSLRKASHKHLKQYGEGMNQLEQVIQDVQEDLISHFQKNIGVPFDPKQVIFDAALSNIAFLLTGVKAKAGDSLLEKMRTYEAAATKFIAGKSDPKFMIYDVWPWTRFFGFKTWKYITSLKDLQDSVYEDVQGLSKKHQDVQSLFKVLISQVQDYNHAEVGVDHVKDSELQYSEDAVQKTLLSLLLAGVTTTSTTFYGIVNILAHNPDIMDKLHQEVKAIGKDSPDVDINMSDRINMPYCRAILLEALRYITILPLGVPHRTIDDVQIDGIRIPGDTQLISNLWTLHHDPDFWKDPFVFRPDRFLDSDGQLVTADHPNRKHLLPFGAGPRVCLGESMALARLFIWTATFAQRFTVAPSVDNKASLTDPRNYLFEGILRVCPYKVVFGQR